MIRLKELREERGWSMTKAAKYLGKPYTTYVNHEKEYREPNSEDLVSYAKAYNVSIDYLVGRTDIKKPATKSDGGWSNGTIDLFSLTEDQRMAIHAVVSSSPATLSVARPAIELLLSQKQDQDDSK